MTDISIIIVSWNAQSFLDECLTSLQTIDGGLAVEIIVVDNASSDGTPDMVRRRFPSVRLVETGANLGFSRGNNIGIEIATGNYICLINSDVNLPSDCLHKMYCYMNNNPTVGLLGPKMLGPDGVVRRSVMRFPTLGNALLRALALDSLFRGRGVFAGPLMRGFNFDQTADVDVINGWFWMTRREALTQVGPLDERFFIYGEDVDWCQRFHLSGWRVVFFADAAAVHYGGASSANEPVRFSVEKQRANLQYWKKYRSRTALFFYGAVMWLEHLLRIFGWSVLYLAGRADRTRATFEVKQNFACMDWLLKSRNTD